MKNALDREDGRGKTKWRYSDSYVIANEMEISEITQVPVGNSSSRPPL